MAGRKPTIDDAVFLAVFVGASRPVLTATEVGERVGMSQQGAHSRLNKLEEEGLLSSQKVGAKARVYWITAEGEEELWLWVSDRA